MLRYLVAIAIIMHGFVHASGVLAAWTKAQSGFTGRPWIFTAGVTTHSLVGRIGGLLWLAALVLLLGSGYGVFARQEWWPTLAIAGAVISLLAIVPWWNTFVSGAKPGALFDIVIFAALILPWGERVVQMLR
jgi:hypothetical protein